MLFRFFFCYWALPENGCGTPTRGKLELECMLVGEQVQIRLRPIDPQFLLLNRGFVKVFTPCGGFIPTSGRGKRTAKASTPTGVGRQTETTPNAAIEQSLPDETSEGIDPPE